VPPKGRAGLARSSVKGPSRPPSPPARISAQDPARPPDEGRRTQAKQLPDPASAGYRPQIVILRRAAEVTSPRAPSRMSRRKRSWSGSSTSKTANTGSGSGRRRSRRRMSSSVAAGCCRGRSTDVRKYKSHISWPRSIGGGDWGLRPQGRSSLMASESCTYRA
jgi:hypothetical protein